MKAFPLFIIAVLLSASLVSASEGESKKYADLVNIYMQLTPLNDQAKVVLPDSIQAVSTSHEGQGASIGLIKGNVKYREQDASKSQELDIATHLHMDEFHREGDKFIFKARVQAVYPAKGLLKSEYGHDEVIFLEGTLEGAVTTMGMFRKDIELASGEKFAISITMAPFTMPPDWKGSVSK